jgi:hypothetical protein
MRMGLIGCSETSVTNYQSEPLITSQKSEYLVTVLLELLSLLRLGFLSCYYTTLTELYAGVTNFNVLHCLA